MNAAVLSPYCPLPADTGGKVEMMKHLELLKGFGKCSILSAARKPVGAGWNSEKKAELETAGYSVRLREDECRRSPMQLAGIAYAALFKGIGLERAFGHSNLYHRYAFPEAWWERHTADAHIAVVNYSYWAWLPCKCPKVVILLDLWSDYMWEGPSREMEDLSSADLVVVISKDEEAKLNGWGITKTLWSPPAVKHSDLPLADAIGCIGSRSKFNVEGLCWLESAASGFAVRVYGGLSAVATQSDFVRVGRYGDALQPYRECGVILLPTAQGMGVQIKAIEALACGRAIVARKGAMRGLPEGAGAWIEVSKPSEMVDAARNLQDDANARNRQAAAANAYYRRYLNYDDILRTTGNAYLQLAGAC